MSKRKRSSEEKEEPEPRALKLQVVPGGGGHKLASDLPLVLRQSCPPKNNPTLFIDFDKKGYHAIVAVNAAGEIQKDDPFEVELNIKWTPITGEDKVGCSPQRTTTNNKGIAWFTRIRAFVLGHLDLTFSAPGRSDIEPLHHAIALLPGDVDLTRSIPNEIQVLKRSDRLESKLIGNVQLVFGSAEVNLSSYLWTSLLDNRNDALKQSIRPTESRPSVSDILAAAISKEDSLFENKRAEGLAFCKCI
jgi:hypothetical protein